jgi:ferrous iron transport protein A
MSNLAELAVGQSARVLQVHGSDEISVRLMEMGITPGAELSLIGKAPLGDPLELVVRGYRLSVRKSEAARIEVQSEQSE